MSKNETTGTYHQAKDLIGNDLVLEAFRRYQAWWAEENKPRTSWKFRPPDFEAMERERMHLVMTILEAAKMVEAYKTGESVNA